MDEKQCSHLLNVIANLERQRSDTHVLWERRVTAFSELKQYSDDLEKRIAEVAIDLTTARQEIVTARYALIAETNRRIELEKQLQALKSQKRAKNGRFK
jgi:chromosome segregation ATPase